MTGNHVADRRRWTHGWTIHRYYDYLSYEMHEINVKIIIIFTIRTYFETDTPWIEFICSRHT